MPAVRDSGLPRSRIKARERALRAVPCLFLALAAGAVLRLDAQQTEPGPGAASDPPPAAAPAPESGLAAPASPAAEGTVDVLPGVVTDGVAAQVNDKVITIAELRGFLRPLLLQMRRNLRGEEYRQAVQTAQRDALDQLIERRLIVEDFRGQELQVPKEWIEKQLTEDVLQRFGGDRLEFLKALRDQGMTYEEYRTQIEERLIVQAMRARKLGEANIPPGEVIAYYEQNKDEFKQEGQVRLRIIQIERPATAEGRDAARAQAEELVGRLASGAPFDELARQYSQGLHHEEGGDWGWVGRGSLRPELEEVALALEPGQHSGVIETDNGYYILRVDEKKPEQYQPIEDVRLEIQERLQENAKARKYREWIEQLRRKAYIKKF